MLNIEYLCKKKIAFSLFLFCYFCFVKNNETGFYIIFHTLFLSAEIEQTKYIALLFRRPLYKLVKVIHENR